LADIQPTIAQAAEQYAIAIDKMKAGLADTMAKLQAQNLTRAQLAEELFSTDFAALIGKELGMDAATGQLALAHNLVLGKMERFGNVTEEMLQALVNLDQATLIGRSKLVADQAKTIVLQNMLQGTEGAVKIKDVIRAGLDENISTAALKTEVNTTLNTFSRAVTNEMAETAPVGTLYVYEGPVDEKTRDICLEMAAAGALTREQVVDQFPGAFLDGGGYNCRHQWTEQDAAFFVDKKNAEERIAAKDAKGKWTKPQTVLEKTVNPKEPKKVLRPIVDKTKVTGAFKEARRRKMNIDNGLNLVIEKSGISQSAVNKAYGALARKGITPSSDSFIDLFIAEL
jgi:hypothetical protein